MLNYYSQHGEDVLLWRLFEGLPPGYFIEVGALDGRRFSNTLSFEEKGWRGLCIEAHPAYIDLLRKARRCTCVHAAAGDHNGTVAFYANRLGSLSRLYPELGKKFAADYGPYFTGFEKMDVPIRTLDSLLEEHGAPCEIELISIDVEGAELAVLQGLSFNKYHPRVIIVEALDKNYEQDQKRFFDAVGYVRARRLSNNFVYCRDKVDAEVLRTAKARAYLLREPHPLDGPESLLVDLDPSWIGTIKRNGFRKVARFLRIALRWVERAY